MSSHPTAVEQRLNDPITEHMRSGFARARVDRTVGEALAELRADPPKSRVLYVYAVDEAGRLQGVVPIRKLLLAAPETQIESVMLSAVVAVPDSATVADACEFFVLHRLLAFPVVDGDGVMLGVVDVDLYTDELIDFDRRQQDVDLFQLIGVHTRSAKPVSSVDAFRGRFPWLMANIAGGLLAALLTGFFQSEIQKTVALALFIPVVLALAESVSIQSVSLALQTLHGPRPTLSRIASRLRAEFPTGLLLGLACGVAVAVVSLAWIGQARLALCIFGGIAGGVTCAALIGVAMPNLLRYLSRDPQVAAGPIALAATDMTTLLLYFLLARWLLG